MSELSNRVVVLEDVVGSHAARMADRLASTSDWGQRLDIVQAALAARLEDGPNVDRRVDWAWDELVRTHGSVEVGWLSSRLEISRKHLIQLFHDQIGLPPKRAARLIRFNRVVEPVQQNDSPDWADLAQCAGFFDQSHLINEVRRFTGKLPTELFRPPGGELAALAVQATARLSR